MPRSVPAPEFASPADRPAASDADKVVHMTYAPTPASTKQLSFIVDLLRDRDTQTCITGVNSRPLTLPLPDPLSMDQAKKLIPWLLNRPKKLTVVPDATPPEVKKFWAHTPERTITEGCWIDGDKHFLVLPTRNERGWNVKIWVPDITADGDLGPNGTWDYVGGKAFLPETAHLATLEEATLFAGKFGRCCMCGREIHVRSSRDAGMGPLCAAKVSG